MSFERNEVHTKRLKLDREYIARSGMAGCAQTLGVGKSRYVILGRFTFLVSEREEWRLFVV